MGVTQLVRIVRIFFTILSDTFIFGLIINTIGLHMNHWVYSMAICPASQTSNKPKDTIFAFVTPLIPIEVSELITQGKTLFLCVVGFVVIIRLFSVQGF